MSSLSAERKFFGRPQNEVPCDSSWLQHEVQARCPLCGVEGAKDAVLSTDHVLPEHPPVTLLRCPACGAAFLQDLTPDYESDMSQMLDYYVEQGAGVDLMAPLLRLSPGQFDAAWRSYEPPWASDEP